MDYKEGRFKEVKKIVDGYECLGDYGWGFARKDSELIKKIAKEDGWKVFKAVDADEHRDGGHDRDYYFISDKYKVFVPVAQQHWDSESFTRYLERVTGKLKKYLVKFSYVSGFTGKPTNATEMVWSHDKKEAEEDGIAWTKSMDKRAKDFKILSVAEQF